MSTVLMTRRSTLSRYLTFRLSPWCARRMARIIVLGRKIELVSAYRCTHSFTPLVYRLASDGSLDATFGVNGIQQSARLKAARALALDPRGRIVIAGVNWVDDEEPVTPGRYELTVLRLRPDGKFDGSFGVNGFYVRPVAKLAILFPISAAMKIHWTRSTSRFIHTGGYRVAIQSRGGWQVS